MTTTVDRPRASTGPSTPPRRTGSSGSSGSSEPKRPASDREARTGGHRTGLGANSRLAWTLAVIGLAGTLVFGVAWLSGRGDGAAAGGTAESGTTAELLAAAKSFSVALTNFDGATVDRDFDRIVARSTGEFRSQADQFFSTEIRTKLKAAQASSRGEVRSAFVQSADGERGTVFVVVDQTIANNQSPQPQADTLRMELGLIRKGDRWLVERVAVLTAPSGGSTGTASTPSTPSGD